MKARIVQLKIFSILMLILIGYNQCGNPYNLETTELEYEEAPLAGSLSSTESVNTFRTSVYSLTSQYCVGCHTTQQPTHAHPDVKTAHDSLIALYKVNFQNPANSRIVAKIKDDNHACWGNCQENSDEMLAMVEIWAEKVNELEEEEEQNTTGSNGGGSTSGSTGASGALSSVGAFEQTVYQLTTEHCIQCHNNTSPQHANQNIQVAHDSLINQAKVNFDNIPSSRMVQRLRADQHNCWGNCEANAVEMENAISQWQALTEEPTGYVAEGVLSAQSDFIANVLSSNSASQAAMINLAGGNVQAPFIYDNANQYLWAPAGTGNNFDANSNTAGMATYNVSVPQAATYKLRANVSAPSNNDNSLFFRVDNGNFFDWHADVNGGFGDQIVTSGSGRQDISFNLTAGNHVVVVKQREDNTKLKELSFVEFNGDTVLPPGTVYLEYELNNLLGVQDSVIFRIKIREFDEYSYQVYAPEIISNYNIRVQNIKLLLNNYYNPQHSTFTFVDKITTPQDPSVSNYAMIVLKDQGPALDKISFEFGALQIMN